jgi:hypothetical protein
MPYVTTRDLKNDVLFRASEKQGSEYGAPVVDYLNRTYKSLCNGASEFLPEYVEDWWWLRGSDNLTLEPAINDGTIAVTKDSASVVFSVPPVASAVGKRIRIVGHPEIFVVDVHTAGVGAATLDSPYTGATNGAAAYSLMKVMYDVSAEVASLISPMIGYRNNPKINGMSPERMDSEWPLPDLSTGIPQSFSLEDNRTVRFSHGGRTDGFSMRIEYRFRRMVADLTDDVSSIPLVPIEWRHILADMALTHVMLAKNDDRSNAHALSARTGLAGMIKENRRRIAKMGGNAGQIYPRMSEFSRLRGPLRTESGLIIGGSA